MTHATSAAFTLAHGEIAAADAGSLAQAGVVAGAHVELTMIRVLAPCSDEQNSSCTGESTRTIELLGALGPR